jgi:hypothetical protein
MATQKPPKQTLQLKVTLLGIQPPIWRRIAVPGDINAFKLHEVLQAVMGWTNGHLHQFVANKKTYGLPDEDSDRETKDERRYTLAQLVNEGPPLVYEYDFGDYWRHRLEVEKVLPADPKATAPKCLDGARACPPEDVGGPGGYENFLEAIEDPKHPEHDDLLEWVGGMFEPEAFSVEETNMELADVWKHGLPSFED